MYCRVQPAAVYAHLMSKEVGTAAQQKCKALVVTRVEAVAVCVTSVVDWLSQRFGSRDDSYVGGLLYSMPVVAIVWCRPRC
jgi:hypothetical protein